MQFCGFRSNSSCDEKELTNAADVVCLRFLNNIFRLPRYAVRRQQTSVYYWASVLENNPILVTPLIKMVQLQDGVSSLQWCRNFQCLSAAAALEPNWQPNCTCGRQTDWALCLEVRSLHQYYLCKTTTTTGVALRKAHIQSSKL